MTDTAGTAGFFLIAKQLHCLLHIDTGTNMLAMAYIQLLP